MADIDGTETIPDGTLVADDGCQNAIYGEGGFKLHCEWGLTKGNTFWVTEFENQDD